ncbi:MAG: 2-oxo acid dehydrogenase subunit E2 [Microbacterium sp.]|uniref:dihydrolipoamide acetyltransferase family protein n=1 Tax=Microbacterium sp. TaxID=51671 RepID=UPI00281863C1|nr:dihydrolipoamide acetyltransferase family protein [Microbacterium sp.]MDR2320283.1 2-oxo acid dehydrogenase subunit E2 [Microbacterium sp.]
MIDILMPRLSDTMTEGAIAAWHRRPGDAIAAGDVLVEIETDKAVMEQESYESGTLAEILVDVGETVAIGTPIARLDDGSGSAPKRSARADASPTPDALAAALIADAPAAASAAIAPNARPEPPREAAERLIATPLVRRLARERGADLSDVRGSGPGGRIVRADLDALPDGSTAPSAAPAPTVAAADDGRGSEVVPFDAIRHTVASRLTESATTTPTFTVTASAEVDALLALRAQINTAIADADATRKVTLNDLFVRAVGLALRAHPGVNASYSPEGRGQTLVHARVNVGIAVASPAGLVVPVVRDADRAAVSVIAGTTKELIGKASERRLRAEELSEGTFTISNLGMYGVEHFTAIINPPQGAILAIGGARDELALIEGAVATRTRVRYTLTADHRIIDGALAAQFLATLTGLIQNPIRIVA